MFERLKAILNKDGSNYFSGLVDPFEFHTTFYKFLVLFKVADIDNKYKPTWLNQNSAIFIAGLIGTILSIISIGHGVDISDISHITEAGAYFMLLCYAIMIVSCTKRNVPQYHNLLRAMKADFYYICTEGDKYRRKFFENQLWTWKVCFFGCIINASIGMLMVLVSVATLIFFLTTHQPGEEESRPLLFPVWLPNVDFGKTPIYEVTFVYVNVTAILYSYNYTFMLQTQVVWIRHIISKADIIIWSIEDLLEGVYPTNNEEESKHFSSLIMERMKKIVKHHQEMLSILKEYMIVHKKLLMFEQKLCGPMVCLTAYCTVRKLEEGELQLILPLLCVSITGLYFIPNYFCTILADKVISIGDACWNTPFWNAGPVIRPYMVLIMQRSMKPLPLQAAGFDAINLETFSKKMTAAYSLFNMLRRMDV